MMIRKTLKEPLFHFLILGIAIFLIYTMMNPSAQKADRIIISSGTVDQMIAGFTRTWHRPPTDQELQGLVNNYIKEEILYREAILMGMDRDDTIVRRRMSQKLEFLSEDLTLIAEPNEQDLQNFLKSHSEEFRIGTKFSFSQIYFNPEVRGSSVDSAAEEALNKLRSGKISIESNELGDPFLLAAQYRLAPQAEVGSLFGTAFSNALQKIETNRWSGPVKSEYGLHLVLITNREDGRLPALSEVRDDVHREYMEFHRRNAKEQFYAGLQKKYEINVELPKTLQSVVRVNGSLK